MLKKFTGEPWPFDRHLVVLQRFDGRQPIKELDFKYCAFWIQIHELQFKFMTLETAMLIGETIAPVITSNNPSEMNGGTFMRVLGLFWMSPNLSVGGGKLYLMRYQRARFLFNMSASLICVSGAVC